jgi:hypothetical protein
VEPAVSVLAASRAHSFSRETAELAALGAARHIYVAGAGASERVAKRIGAERLTSDPVTAAAEIAMQKKNRPAAATGR